MSKEDKKDEMLLVRLPENVKHALKIKASLEKCFIRELIEKIVTEYIKKAN